MSLSWKGRRCKFQGADMDTNADHALQSMSNVVGGSRQLVTSSPRNGAEVSMSFSAMDEVSFAIALDWEGQAKDKDDKKNDREAAEQGERLHLLMNGARTSGAGTPPGDPDDDDENKNTMDVETLRQHSPFRCRQALEKVLLLKLATMLKDLEGQYHVYVLLGIGDKETLAPAEDRVIENSESSQQLQQLPPKFAKNLHWVTSDRETEALLDNLPAHDRLLFVALPRHRMLLQAVYEKLTRAHRPKVAIVFLYEKDKLEKKDMEGLPEDAGEKNNFRGQLRAAKPQVLVTDVGDADAGGETCRQQESSIEMELKVELSLGEDREGNKDVDLRRTNLLAGAATCGTDENLKLKMKSRNINTFALLKSDPEQETELGFRLRRALWDQSLHSLSSDSFLTRSRKLEEVRTEFAHFQELTLGASASSPKPSPGRGPNHVQGESGAAHGNDGEAGEVPVFQRGTLQNQSMYLPQSPQMHLRGSPQRGDAFKSIVVVDGDQAHRELAPGSDVLSGRTPTTTNASSSSMAAVGREGPVAGGFGKIAMKDGCGGEEVAGQGGTLRRVNSAAGGSDEDDEDEQEETATATGPGSVTTGHGTAASGVPAQAAVDGVPASTAFLTNKELEQAARGNPDNMRIKTEKMERKKSSKKTVRRFVAGHEIGETIEYEELMKNPPAWLQSAELVTFGDPAGIGGGGGSGRATSTRDRDQMKKKKVKFSRAAQDEKVVFMEQVGDGEGEDLGANCAGAAGAPSAVGIQKQRDETQCARTTRTSKLIGLKIRNLWQKYAKPLEDNTTPCAEEMQPQAQVPHENGTVAGKINMPSLKMKVNEVKEPQVGAGHHSNNLNLREDHLRKQAPAAAAGGDESQPPQGPQQQELRSSSTDKKDEWRVDCNDGLAYRLNEFIAEYGGSESDPPEQWLSAVVVRTDALVAEDVKHVVGATSCSQAPRDITKQQQSRGAARGPEGVELQNDENRVELEADQWGPSRNEQNSSKTKTKKQEQSKNDEDSSLPMLFQFLKHPLDQNDEGEDDETSFRVDPNDGQAYKLWDFLLEYGGSVSHPPAEWKRAKTVQEVREELLGKMESVDHEEPLVERKEPEPSQSVLVGPQLPDGAVAPNRGTVAAGPATFASASSISTTSSTTGIDHEKLMLASQKVIDALLEFQMALRPLLAQQGPGNQGAGAPAAGQ